MRNILLIITILCSIIIAAGCGAPARNANHNPAPYVQTHLTPIRIDDFKQNDTFITSNYVWKYANIEWHWELQIPTNLFTYFQNLSRPIVDGFNYSVYIIHSSDDYLINIMASEILKVSRLHGFSDKETIEFASSFVQAIPNSPDSTTGFDEYPRYPVETLVDKTGDCEDSAILLGSLLQSMGKELVLIFFPDGHYGIGVLGKDCYDTNGRKDDLFGTHWVHNGEKYFYIETTFPNNTIGEIPNLFAHLPVIIYDIPTLPS
jgi:predicted transglutaminase-like cysteine proteinase